MKRREALLVLIAGAVVVMALLTVFAIELSNTQAKSKQDVRGRVHERATLAAALIDGLFQAVQQQVPQYAKTYGSRTVSAATLDEQRSQSHSGGYLALLDQSGNVLVTSTGFTQQARADLRMSAALRLIREGRPYGLGNLLPYGRTGVINFGVTFPTRFGERTLLTGFTLSALGAFLTTDLRKIPGVQGAHNYLLDGNDVVLASTNPRIRAGHVIRKPGAVQALQRISGDVNGQYFDQVGLTNSTWRVVLSAPNGPLFASVSGPRKWLPWLIFAAFALFALVALLLGRRALRGAAELRDAHDRLALRGAELAHANEALGHRAAELERSNSELEHFASIASHDLQEPLRKVRTFTQRVTTMESANLSPKGHDYLQRANAAASRMQFLIQDLLRFSRVATHQRPFARVDLDQVTREVLRDLSDQVSRSGASVHIGDLPTISADPVQLRQLMQNLISNALKFRRPEVDHEVMIEAGSDGDMLEITVHDNGIGFEAQYGERIFGVFERLHGRNEYSGTGIGLALCRKIAERHGGTIVAEGVPRAGATFTVSLPLWVTDVAGADQRETDRTHVAA